MLMPNTNNQSKTEKCVLQARLKSRLGCAYTRSGKRWGI